MSCIITVDNSDPIIFFEFFLDFLSFFWCNLKVGSLFAGPKIIFLDFCHFFWCNLKVGSLFVPENSDPKIIFRFFPSVLNHSTLELRDFSKREPGS